MDPNDYVTRGPRKPRKGKPRGVGSQSLTSGRKQRGRGRGGARAASHRSTSQPKPLGESRRITASKVTETGASRARATLLTPR